MKLTSTIVLLATSQLFAADCTDPLDPACQSTNNSGTNSWPLNYPPGSLHWIVASSNKFVLTNTLPNHTYQIQDSTNALNWDLFHSWALTNAGTVTVEDLTGDPIKFYRARDTYFQTVYGTVQRVTNSYPCFGSYEGYATYYYYEEGENWGNVVNTNTYWQFFGTGNSNEYVVVLGRYGDGDQYCASNSITFHAIDPYYRFSLYFKSNAPAAGTLYPVLMGGFLEQD